MNTFYTGQKVVCIDDSNVPGEWGASVSEELHKGKIYTVRWIGMWTSYVDPVPILGVRLEELYRDIGDGRGDVPFYAWRFRPLLEKKTDISIFRSLLNPARHKVLEDA